MLVIMPSADFDVRGIVGVVAHAPANQIGAHLPVPPGRESRSHQSPARDRSAALKAHGSRRTLDAAASVPTSDDERHLIQPHPVIR
jgi:hypothetical protein